MVKGNMYKLETTRTFRKALKKIKHSGNFPEDMFILAVDTLLIGKSLSKKFHDHSLSGNMKTLRECHIKPDILLVYKKESKTIILVDIGTHEHIFG
jgi:mRNA interferase YafQ